jgi:hypothetical protein
MTPTLLAVPADAMAYNVEEAAIGGKPITKLEVVAGIGKPLALLTAVSGPM